MADLDNRRNELYRQSRDILKRKCKRLKVSGEGSKGDIINRLLRRMYGDNAFIDAVPQRQDEDARILALQNRRKLLLQRRLQYKSPVIISKKVKNKPKNGRNVKNVKTGKISKRMAMKLVQKKSKYLTLQFVGIRPPKLYRHSNYHHQHQFDDIKVQSIRIRTKLTGNSTVSQLKQFIKKTYSIPLSYDVQIFCGHVQISHAYTSAKLKHFGIGNHSLLTLAISVKKGRNIYTQGYTQPHLFLSIQKTQQSTKNEMQRGLDIITQESDVNMYRMPGCGHLMSKDSLYYYALSSFMNQSNLYLTCPHVVHSDDTHSETEQKYDDIDDLTTAYNGKWSCPQCTYSNRGRPTCAQCGHKKPRKTAHSTNQCNEIWHYLLVKQILNHKPVDDIKDNVEDLNIAKLGLLSARNKLENEHNDKKVNLQKCYHCKTLYYKSLPRKTRNNQSRQFRTRCILCKNHFCWNCGKKYNRDHICDGSWRRAIVQILKRCPTKRIGPVSNVPSVRACPNERCGQLITHVTACKHMRCRSCSVSFCFVCMRPTVNGRWQCGGSSDRCNIAPRQTLRTMKIVSSGVEIKKSFQLW